MLISNNISELEIDNLDNLYLAKESAVYKWKPGASEGVLVAGGNGSGSALNQFQTQYNTTIKLDQSGNIYIGESYPIRRIVKWEQGGSEGVIVASKYNSLTGGETNSIDNYNLFEVDNAGSVYVLGDEGYLSKWSSNGSVYERILGPNSSALDKYFKEGSDRIILSNGARGIHLSSNGNLYVSDNGFQRVLEVKYRPEITIAAGSTTGSLNPHWSRGRCFYRLKRTKLLY